MKWVKEQTSVVLTVFPPSHASLNKGASVSYPDPKSTGAYTASDEALHTLEYSHAKSKLVLTTNSGVAIRVTRID